jgi:D-glycero-D-manno-heptose 1,7-bisphosphate phosphatase
VSDLPGPSRLIPAGSRFADGRLSERGALFLDRDGVIIEDVHFLRRIEDMRFTAGATEGLSQLQDAFDLVVVTNQSGVARGYFTEGDLEAMHQEMVRRLAERSVRIDAIYSCHHLPEADSPTYGVECACRKPKPGMTLQAAEDWAIDLTASFTIGDSERDVAAGRAAGTAGILMGDAQGSGVKDLRAAAALLLSDEGKELLSKERVDA